MIPQHVAGNGGGPYNTLKGAVNVHIADVHNAVVNDYLHRHTAVATTLAVAASAGDTSITVVSTTGFTAQVGTTPGDLIHLGATAAYTEPVHPELVVLPGSNVMTLDRPLDNDYEIGTPVLQAIADMSSVAGTLAAPVAYRYYPGVGRVEHILRLIVQMVHGTAGDDSTFGDLNRLTNGAVLRAHISGADYTFTNWKANADLRLDMFEVVYTDKAGPGVFGISARGAFSELSVAVRLDQAQGDYLELLVQDNITGLDDFRIKVQGHIEGE